MTGRGEIERALQGFPRGAKFKIFAHAQLLSVIKHFRSSRPLFCILEADARKTDLFQLRLGPICCRFIEILQTNAVYSEENMFASIWAFVQDPANRALLGWIGGGFVVVIGGFWTAFQFLLSKEKPNAQLAPTVSASNGGVAAGRDISGTTINTRGGSKR
jgi:hypothetical protein